MRNKHPKGWMDTPHHIEFLKKKRHIFTDFSFTAATS